MEENNNNNQDLNIEVPEDVASGVFSNLALINHSTTEFVFDFIQIMPGMPKAQVKSRIIMTPEHARRLAEALNENLKSFEEQFKQSSDDTYHLNLGPKGQA